MVVSRYRQCTRVCIRAHSHSQDRVRVYTYANVSAGWKARRRGRESGFKRMEREDREEREEGGAS